MGIAVEMTQTTTIDTAKKKSKKALGYSRSKNLVRSVTLDTLKSFERMLSGKHTFYFGNRAIVAQPVDIIRWLSDHIPYDRQKLHIRNMLLNGVAAAEARAAGSGIISLVVACEIIHHRGVYSGSHVIESIKNHALSILRQSHRCSSKEAYAIIKKYDCENASSSLALKALQTCSSNAALSIEHDGEKTGLDIIDGHTFPSSVPPIFQAAAQMSNKKTLKSPRVLIIDGIVERMSEIDGIIRGSHVSKTPVVIFARGFQDDAQNTLGKNYALAGLQVIPLIVPFDELGANLLNDIAVVTGADMISSFKGEVVSSRCWSDLKTIDIANISQGKISIVENGCASRVHRQRRMLRLKRQECSSMEVEIIDKRLKCLMGSGVSLTIGNDTGNLFGIYKDRIGSHVRLFKSCANHGIVDLNISTSLPAHECAISSDIFNTLSKRTDLVPADALAVGVKAGIAIALGLASIGDLVYVDL